MIVAKTKKKRVEYEGQDIEALNSSRKYYTWIISYMKKYLGKKVLEVGAGAGTFSQILIENDIKELMSLEPSGEMYPHLKKLSKKVDIKMRTSNSYLEDIKARVKKEKFNSAVYINVFEHIEDDEAELAYLYEALPKGAYLCIFVPANPFLMSKFDKSIGHYRRYTKKELEQKVKDAGFTIKESRKFDFIGVLPWYVNFTLLGTTKMQPSAAKTYDKLVVPVARRIESVAEPLFGKNVLLIAKKTK